MNKYLIALILSFLGAPLLAAVPNSITYQGSFKQSGAPATGTHQIRFEVVDQALNVVWSMPTSTPIIVNNGLFSTTVSPNVNWLSVGKILSLVEI